MKARPIFLFILATAALLATSTFAASVDDYLRQVRKLRSEAKYKEAQTIIGDAFLSAAPESREMALVLRARGMNQIDQGHARGALPDLEKSLKLFEKIDGPQSSYAAGLMNDIGVAYYSIGEHEEALEWYSKSLPVRERLFGAKHYDVAQTLNNLAWCHLMLEQPEVGRPEIARAIEIMRQIEPQGRSLASYLFGMGYLLNTQGKTGEALPYLEEAADLAEKTFGKTHPETRRYVRTLKTTKEIDAKKRSSN